MRFPLLKLVPDNTNIDFYRWRGIAILFSIAMLALAAFFLVTKGLNLGVDFQGGQMVRVTFVQPVDQGELRARVGALGLGEPSLQSFGNDRTIEIHLPQPEGSDAAVSAAVSAVRDTVTTGYPGARVDAVETVSGKISDELYRQGAISLVLAMLGIAMYIWIRFEWQFGVGALVSLVHDLVIVLGFYAATQIDFSLNAVAALLTLIGFSLNDTVVVYDRIRENLRKYRKMEIEPLLNLSVNETLSRTVNTNTSLLIAVLALVLIGPTVIFDLTIGILAGVVIGTYSSIYVARFLLVPLGVGPDSFVPATGVAASAERVDDGARV